MDKKIICHECNKEIIPGNDAAGLPNGVGFQLQDGRVISICRECLINLGRQKENEKK